MSKAIFICNDCDNTKEIDFETGSRPEPPVCEKCNKEMKRKFGNVNKGRVIPDDILYVSRMMSYHSSKN